MESAPATTHRLWQGTPSPLVWVLPPLVLPCREFSPLSLHLTEGTSLPRGVSGSLLGVTVNESVPSISPGGWRTRTRLRAATPRDTLPVRPPGQPQEGIGFHLMAIPPYGDAGWPSHPLGLHKRFIRELNLEYAIGTNGVYYHISYSTVSSIPSVARGPIWWCYRDRKQWLAAEW